MDAWRGDDRAKGRGGAATGRGGRRLEEVERRGGERGEVGGDGERWMRGGGDGAGRGEEVAEGRWLVEEGCAAEGRRWRRGGRRRRGVWAAGRSPAEVGGGVVG